VSKGWVVFVHGCFWHAHAACARATVPKRNREFWVSKFRANRRRDRRVLRETRALGLRAIVVWECETRDMLALSARLRRELPRRDHG
jgi:DNA mismatch endonuclease, patch repair protein